ncbi:hypothetical protein HUG17_3188 [Dermatophagoides farinae]|uniref:ZP domain-containing protein n=1 Tax=Dermatophagoides farinae TaxID=6954 RepID=A0A9D4NX31_DERFA|nr:hypothetical protein HUG17_3188 [Dermatophagoides farinae]
MNGYLTIVMACLLFAIADHSIDSPTHKSDDSIDVSSSIGVSSHHHDGSNGGGGSDGSSNSGNSPQHLIPGMVEDLLANESTMDGSIRIPSPIGPASLSHAAVVDSESDLMGAESDSKFSLSKLKRPFARLPFDLRFNTRFLNGPLMTSSSNMLRQVHHSHPPPPQPMRGPGPQMMLQPGPQNMRPSFPPNGPNPGHRGPPPPQFQQHPPPPGYGSHQPIFKSLPPHGSNGIMQPGPKSLMPPQPQSQMMHHQGPPPPPPQQQQQQQGPPGSPAHIDIEPVGMSGIDPMVHTIAEYIDSGDDRHNELINDYDRQTSSNEIWPIAQPELAKIVHLDVKCEKNFMKVSVEFDRPFNGIIFSKGHFSQPNCIHLPSGSGRSSIYFDIRIDSCGTTGNMGPNSLTAYGNVNAGNFFENTVIFQYDPFVQEAWDQARKLRCTWHDQYEKSVSFRPFPVDMVDVVRADFAGDNVGCWMQIQVGRGPWASEVAGIVKIGQTMTMVLAIKDEENKFDMLVRNCVAHDGKRAPIELVDTNGCIVRSKLMSKFTKIKNFGSSASVLSYAHFQAFKFPDSMEVHFQCTIQICKNSCPEQCDQSGQSNIHYINHQITGTMQNLQNHRDIMGGSSGGDIYLSSDLPSAAAQIGELPGRSDNSVLARPREVRDVSGELKEILQETNVTAAKEVGVEKVIRVISTGDLSFATSDKLTAEQQSIIETNETSNGTSSSHPHYRIGPKSWLSEKINEKICMSSINFLVCFVTLSTLALFFCTCSVVMCCRKRSIYGDHAAAAAMLHGAVHLNGKSSSKKTSAKEAQLIKNGKRSKHEQNSHDSSYGSQQTVIPVMSGNGTNGGYLSSSSILSPRVQATAGGTNGYVMYH